MWPLQIVEKFKVRRPTKAARGLLLWSSGAFGMLDPRSTWRNIWWAMVAKKSPYIKQKPSSYHLFTSCFLAKSRPGVAPTSFLWVLLKPSLPGSQTSPGVSLWYAIPWCVWSGNVEWWGLHGRIARCARKVHPLQMAQNTIKRCLIHYKKERLKVIPRLWGPQQWQTRSSRRCEKMCLRTRMYDVPGWLDGT